MRHVVHHLGQDAREYIEELYLFLRVYFPTSVQLFASVDDQRDRCVTIVDVVVGRALGHPCSFLFNFLPILGVDVADESHSCKNDKYGKDQVHDTFV